MPDGPQSERPLRVAVDATSLLGHQTGVGAFCAGALGGLAARSDVAVSAFAVSWRRRQLLASLVPAGVEVRQRAMPARPLHRSWAHTEEPPVEWFVGPVDVVHGPNFVVPPTRRAARVVSVLDLTTVRFRELCDGPTLAYPNLIRRALRRGAWVHAPSAFVAAEVVDLLGADPDRVRTVPLGVPALPAPGPGAAARFLPPGTGRYVLAVGTAEPRKDLPGLVAAFDDVASDRPDLALVLAGPDGWGVRPLMEAVDRAAARDRIVRTGWLDAGTLSGLLHEATILAYPSVYEGFGFPPLQAMAAGVPVVATRAGSLPEVLGDAAWLVEVGDRPALAGALADLLDSAELRASLVDRGRSQAQRFTWSGCAAGLAALYGEAAS